MKKIIKSGTACFISKAGHNNFIYPILDEAGLTYFKKDAEDYQIKSWICGRSYLTAVVVNSDVLDNNICKPGTKTVVWIDARKVKIL